MTQNEISVQRTKELQKEIDRLMDHLSAMITIYTDENEHISLGYIRNAFEEIKRTLQLYHHGEK